MKLQPTAAKLPQLRGQTRRFFANWLGVGIAGFLVDGRGREAFPGASNYVGWATAIEDDLALIYGALDRADQNEFRLGLVLCLCEGDVGAPEWIPVSTSLLRLSALIGCHEVLDVIPSIVIATADFESEAYASLCSLAFDVCIELAVPGPQALECLLLVISSRGFRDILAGPALISLVKASPDRFPSHLDVLELPLNARYHPDALSVGGAWVEQQRDELLVELANWTPIVSMAKAFDVRLRRATISSDWFLNDWFCRGLIESENSRVINLRAQVDRWIHAAIDDGEPHAPRSTRHSAMDVIEEALGELPERKVA